MKQQSKFSPEQAQQAAHAQQASQQQSAREFANAEELLRHDAAQIEVPPEIAARLKASSATLPPPKQPWWKQLFTR
jgi:hypothetical protein